MVNKNNPLAIERGAKWIEIDLNKMKAEKTFSLQITLEPFVKDVFWRLWNN